MKTRSAHRASPTTCAEAGEKRRAGADWELDGSGAPCRRVQENATTSRLKAGYQEVKALCPRLFLAGTSYESALVQASSGFGSNIPMQGVGTHISQFGLTLRQDFG